MPLAPPVPSRQCFPSISAGLDWAQLVSAGAGDIQMELLNDTIYMRPARPRAALPHPAHSQEKRALLEHCLMQTGERRGGEREAGRGVRRVQIEGPTLPMQNRTGPANKTAWKKLSSRQAKSPPAQSGEKLGTKESTAIPHLLLPKAPCRLRCKNTSAILPHCGIFILRQAASMI